VRLGLSKENPDGQVHMGMLAGRVPSAPSIRVNTLPLQRRAVHMLRTVPTAMERPCRAERRPLARAADGCARSNGWLLEPRRAADPRSASLQAAAQHDTPRRAAAAAGYL